MKFRHWIEYAFALSFCWVFRLLPRKLALEAGALLGKIFWQLGIRKNLVECKILFVE